MVFPCLVDKRFCKTPIDVYVDSTELSEDGELETIEIKNALCNLQMGAKASFTVNKEAIEISGVALFIGDLFPTQNLVASGYVILNGVKYDIVKGQKHLNPDGTVNYTSLELV